MIKKILKVFVLVIIATLAVIQFFPIDKTNPPIVEDESLEAVFTVPDNVRAILERSCSDCHSHKTVYPWYAYVQPAGWFLKSHIDDGRKELNFSILGTYSPKKKARKFEEICEKLESKEMPLPSYLWIHRDSILREGEAKALCDWASRERERIELPEIP